MAKRRFINRVALSFRNRPFISQATRLEVNYVDDYGAKRKITYNLD